MSITFGSLFSGIGGFDIGFDRAGMTCFWQCEIDQKAREVLQRHWSVKIYDDVRAINKNNTEPVDLICGGFPCQDLSIAGKRKGLAGERSGLWFDFARIIDELEPKWVVIENVPGLLSSNKGADFAVILRWLVERGYGVSWRILDAQYFGVAQRRRRVFIVASFRSGRSAKVLFEHESSQRDPAESREGGERTPSTFTIRSGKEGGEKGYLGRDDGAMTLGGQQQYLSGVMPSGQANAEITENIAPTLNLLHESPICWEMQHASEAYREAGKIAPNLQARMGTGGNNVPLVGVRRLTPTECARLQGFPDDWNDWLSDSSRYKQYGNAVCVNVAEWIGKRIIEIEKVV